MKNKVAKLSDDYGIPLGLGDKIKDLDVDQMFSGVKPFLQDQQKIKDEVGNKLKDAMQFAEDNKHHIETMKNVG